MSAVDREARSLRSAYYATRPISRDNLVPEDPALGLVAFSSPFDPEPSLRIEEGRVVELDGKPESEFDLIDEFVARHGLNQQQVLAHHRDVGFLQQAIGNLLHLGL